jgi:hypothetical protein
VGCPRSGNTLLGCILNKHPDLLIFFEQTFYSSLHRKWAYYVKKGEDRRAVFLRLATESCADLLQASGTTEEEVGEAVCSVEPEWKYMLNAFVAVIGENGKPSAVRFGDKTPHHVAYINAIKEDYPDAQFLLAYRDPRDTVYSMSKASFPHTTDKPLLNALVARQYYEAIPGGIESAKRDRSVKVIKYEDVVADPVAEIKKICEFVEIEYLDDMVQEKKGKIQSLVGFTGEGNKGWEKIEPQKSSKKNPLKEDETINWILGDWIERFGYEKSGSSLDSMQKVQDYLRSLPFRMQKNVFRALWKIKYPDSPSLFFPKPPSASMLLSWAKGGE